jgi:hypothetical protein
MTSQHNKPKKENTDIEAMMSLREEIERWQGENGQ